jgi:serine/threonine protein kinase
MEKQIEHVGLAQAQGPNVKVPDSERELESKQEPELIKEEPEPEPKIEQELEPKIEEPEPKIEQELEPKIEQELEPEPKQDLEPKIEQELEPEPKQELEPEPKQELEPEPEPVPKKEKHPSKLINHGQYGCIYKPQIGCEEDEDNDDDNYVSKIQEKTEELEKEINTGKIIQSIDNYFFYYAPIIKSCDVNISNIDINILRGCEVALNENREINTVKKYASNKIRYISKYTISDYIQQLSSKENFKRIANVHLYLLEYSIPKLLEKNVIHLDLKTNNIMWDEKQEIPIIIDFGLSINMGEVLDPQKSPAEKIAIYKKYFIGEEYYIFWCVDIHMISQIVQLYMNEKIVLEHVLEIILNKIIQNDHFKRLFTTNERNEYIKKYNEYFKKYINSPWTNVITDLLQEKIYSTWDSHSICSAILFDIVINKSFISNNDTKKEAYMKLLKEVVLSMPDKRIGIEDTKKRLYEIMLMPEEKIETPPIPMPRQSLSFFM